MSNKGRPDRLVPQAARLGKRKRGSALIQAMNERDEALKAENTLPGQYSAEPQESDVPQSSKEVQVDQYSAEPQESGVPQSGTKVQVDQPTEMNLLLSNEKAEISAVNVQSHEEKEKRNVTFSQEEEIKQVNIQQSRKIDNHEESILIKDPEEKLEKVTFYITLPQLEKLEDMVYEYKKRTRVRRANRNDIIRILIDQSSIADLFK